MTMIFRYLIVIMFLSPIYGWDVSAFDFMTGHGTGLGGTVILSESSASMLVSVPSGGISPGEAKVQVSANRNFEMKELDQVFMAMAYRYHQLTPSFGLAQLGHGDFYLERIVKANLAWHFDSLTVGVSLSSSQISFGNHYGGLGAVTLGSGISWRTARFYAALVTDNLTSPEFGSASPALNPRYAFYVEIEGEGMFSLMGRATLEKTERPQFAIGQKTDFFENGSLYWGLSSAPLEYGGGVEMALNRNHLGFFFCYHPSLGFSRSVSLSIDIGASPNKEDHN